MKPIFAAHLRENGMIQSVKKHLEGAATLAKKFGSSFGSGDYAYLCGMLHDIGKYSDKFQKRIYEGGKIVDHSTAGAKTAVNQYGTVGRLLAYCIAGHHAGLPDGGGPVDTSDEATLCGRLKKEVEPFEKFKEEIDLNLPTKIPPLPIRPLKKGFSTSFYVRMLFSCLVDADFLDTEIFMSTSGIKRDVGESIEALNVKLDAHLEEFKNPLNDINRKRSEILNCCIEKSSWKKWLYALTVPTGGGKTLSSLAFALKHAKKHKMDRVIYVIPYTSIIEQNADVFKDVLGQENVLEHHSNFSYDDTNEMLIRQRLATENWDMPVIVTTTVQFFESLFANKTSKCRKLHNMANSVIVFDEAQMLPNDYLLPCVNAISELVYNYGCTVVLCSATQPALGSFWPKELVPLELCDHANELFAFFKRTEFVSAGELQDTELAKRLNAEKQVLCVVNTRKQAQNVYRLLKKKGSYHLSTLMYPLHRTEILKEIKNRLKKHLPCHVVSTSLIEAGVDVDFPVVYRADAGLDSEIQAAGRCNREGRRKISPVYIFRPSEEYRRQMPDTLKRPAEIARSVASRFDDIASPEAIDAYFSDLYAAEGQRLDGHGIIESLEDGFEKGLSFPFAQIASEFRLIENATYAVVIPDNDIAAGLVRRLKNGEYNRQLLRNIQQYSVNIYPYSYKALHDSGYIEPLGDDFAVLINLEKYSRKTGLDVGSETGRGIFA
jgi:CRISPR-associated endonuclease/helicase Cas3